MSDNKVLGIVFSNMHDHSLGELTEHRTVGSVPFGGRYRLVDFVLSNMVNSGIRDVGIITKSNYQSLMDHVGAGREWDLSRKIGGLVILPPFSRTGSGIYRGSIDALKGIMGYIQHIDAKYVFLSDCDVITNFDVRQVINRHAESGADITVLYKKLTVNTESSDMVAFALDDHQRVVDVSINPGSAGEYNMYLNMAVVERQLLIKLVNEAHSHGHYSFSQSVLQDKVGQLKIYGYPLEGYCARIRDQVSYFAANMQLLQSDVRAHLFPKERPVYTKVRDEVPARYGLRAQVSDSMVADGCIIEGSVENSIIFRGVKIGRGATVRNSIIMQGSVIGENASLNYIITDKDVTIRDNRTLAGYLTYPVYLQKGISV